MTWPGLLHNILTFLPVSVIVPCAINVRGEARDQKAEGCREGEKTVAPLRSRVETFHSWSLDVVSEQKTKTHDL